MGQIPAQLASRLPAGSISTGARVIAADENGMSLESGERLEASTAVLAVDAAMAAELTGEPVPILHEARCLYFAAERSPLGEPILVVNGEGRGPDHDPLRPERRGARVRAVRLRPRLPRLRRLRLRRLPYASLNGALASGRRAAHDALRRGSAT
jgi:hypothetical protein